MTNRPTYLISTHFGKIPNITTPNKPHYNRPFIIYVDDIFYTNSYYKNNGTLSLKQFCCISQQTVLKFKFSKCLQTFKGVCKISESVYVMLVVNCKPDVYEKYDRTGFVLNSEFLHNSESRSESLNDSESNNESLRSSESNNESSRSSESKCEFSHDSRSSSESSQDPESNSESSQDPESNSESSSNSESNSKFYHDPESRSASSHDSESNSEFSRSSESNRESSQDSESNREHLHGLQSNSESSHDSVDYHKCTQNIISSDFSCYEPLDIDDFNTNLHKHSVFSTNFVNMYSDNLKMLILNTGNINVGDAYECDDVCCEDVSKGYLRHMIDTHEICAKSVVTNHNYYQIYRFFEKLNRS